jgi:transposase
MTNHWVGSLETHRAGAYLKRWYQWARSSRIEEMKRFAQTIKQHWSGVLRFHQSRMTAGFLEGINRLVHEPTPILWTKCGVT